MEFFAPFTIPFSVGVIFMTFVIVWKYVSWFFGMSRVDRRSVERGIFTSALPKTIWEVIRESLLHVRIFKVSPRLGYMHSSLAFGWFLLILFGWIETTAYLGLSYVPLRGHVFFKYFSAGKIHEHIVFFDQIMDLLLLFVLSGVGLAWLKRFRSRWLGIGKTTKHVLTDRLALSFLWFVFPLRLLAESITAAIYHEGGFLTGSIGNGLDLVLNAQTLNMLSEPVWWMYSIALGGFFIFMPFSRYMHIFTEVPLILLRNCKLRPTEKARTYDNFEIQACSRCGICIDPCQLQDVLGINSVQSVYFLRDRRYNMLRLSTAANCLMCGRCEEKCPVGINLNTLRLNSRSTMRNIPNERRYNYFGGLDRSSGNGKVGYFAGCMTLLTPRTMESMKRIFEASGEEVWWADKDGGVCCGRPLKLSGETDSAEKMMAYNTSLFRSHGITTLITSCPICLRVFREDYDLRGIEVIHHTEYIARLIASGRLRVEKCSHEFVYHDPCELGRGCGVYDAPRDVVSAVGKLREAAHNRKNALCCGGSLANTVISDAQQQKIASRVVDEMEDTGADTIVTACPLCKRTLSRAADRRVADISEIVAENINLK